MISQHESSGLNLSTYRCPLTWGAVFEHLPNSICCLLGHRPASLQHILHTTVPLGNKTTPLATQHFKMDNESDIFVLLCIQWFQTVRLHPSSPSHSIDPPINQCASTGSSLFARLHHCQFHVQHRIQVVGVLPAIPNGAPNPRAVDQVSNLVPRSFCQGHLPMKLQYLRAKNLVNGLNGKLFLGPSG